MPQRFFHALSDDPVRFDKQIGCMTGLFQIFDQPQNVTRKQSSEIKRMNSTAQLFAADSNRENFGGFGHAIQTDGTIFDTSRRYSLDSLRQQKANAHSKRLPRASPSLNDDVRRPLDTNGYLARASFNAKDPPRSSFDSKAVPRLSYYVQDPTRIQDRSKYSSGFSSSAKSTAALREPPRSSFDSSELRDLVRASYMKDQPRSSVDGREVPRFSFEMSRSVVNSYDAPRSSLDGKEVSRSTFDSKFKESPRRSFDGKASSKDPLEDLKESLRTLAKLQEATKSFVDGCERPRISMDSKEAPRQTPFKTSSMVTSDGWEAPRSSSFDYKDAIRVSQRAQEAPRLSLDGREIPRSVLELREAIQARLDGLDISGDPPRTHDPKRDSVRSFYASDHSTSNSLNASVTKDHAKDVSRRVPNVVARLMGLEDLPATIPAVKPKLAQKQPSKEAKLLQDLLQYRPPHGPRQHAQSQEGRKTSIPSQLSEAQQPSRPVQKTLRTELSSQLTCQFAEEARLSGELERTGRGVNSDLQGGMRQQREPSVFNRPQGAVLNRVATPKYAVEGMPASRKQQESRPKAQGNSVGSTMQDQENIVTLLEKSKETKQDQHNNSFHEEIERRLRHLGLQSTEQERKTLKQILEAMHLKGLLHRPRLKQEDDMKQGPVSSDPHPESVTTRVKKSCSDASQGMAEEMHPIIGRSHSPMKEAQLSTNGQQVETSIVIMKPLTKSPRRARLQQLGSSLAPRERECTSDVQSILRKSLTASDKNKESLGTGLVANGRLSSASKLQQSSNRHNKDEIVAIQLRREKTTDLPNETASRGGNTRGHLSKALVQPTLKSSGTERKGSFQKQSTRNKDGGIRDGFRKSKEESTALYGISSANEQISGCHSVKRSGLETVRQARIRSADVSPVSRRIENVPTRGLLVEAEFLKNKPAISKTPQLGEKSRAQKPKPDEIVQNASKISSEEGIPTVSASGFDKTVAMPGAAKDEATVNEDAGKLESPRSRLTDPTTEVIEQAEKKAKHGDIPILQKPKVAIPSVESQQDVELRTPPGHVLERNKSSTTGKYGEELLAEEREQCSPVSVLDAHSEEDNSSPEMIKICVTTSKVALSNDDSSALGKSIQKDESTTKITPCELRFSLENTDQEASHEQTANNSLRAATMEGKEYKYVTEIFSSSGLMESSGVVWKRWISSGCTLQSDLYSKLEEKWEAAQERDLETHELAKDRDFGGELYMKGRQEALRRRLLFDCVNDILARRLSPAAFADQHNTWSKARARLRVRGKAGKELVVEVWNELQRLPGVSSEKLKDDMVYTILQKDLRQSTDPWSDLGARVADVVQDLEEMIYGDLVEEFLGELSLQTEDRICIQP